jgi:hypothetical protein
MANVVARQQRAAAYGEVTKKAQRMVAPEKELFAKTT